MRQINFFDYLSASYGVIALNSTRLATVQPGHGRARNAHATAERLEFVTNCGN
jgi:hypothetical protein